MSSKNKTGLIKIPTRLRLQPKSFNTAPSSKARTLQLLAKTHSNSHHKTPPKLTSHQQRSHVNATKELTFYQPEITTDLPSYAPIDVAPPQETDNAHKHNLFFTIVTSSDIRKSYIDQTGKFP